MNARVAYLRVRVRAAAKWESGVGGLLLHSVKHVIVTRLSPLSFSLSPTRYSLGPTDGTIAIIDDFLGNDGEWPFVSHCLAYEYLTPTSASACFVGTSAASHHFKLDF